MKISALNIKKTQQLNYEGLFCNFLPIDNTIMRSTEFSRKSQF